MSAGIVAGGIGLTAGTIAGVKAYQDQTDNERDSINGYLGYGILAAIGADYLGAAVGGPIGRGIAGAGILGAVVGGGLIGIAVAKASGNA